MCFKYCFYGTLSIRNFMLMSHDEDTLELQFCTYVLQWLVLKKGLSFDFQSVLVPKSSVTDNILSLSACYYPQWLFTIISSGWLSSRMDNIELKWKTKSCYGRLNDYVLCWMRSINSKWYSTTTDDVQPSKTIFIQEGWVK
jgi:hypothetical protein